MIIILAIQSALIIFLIIDRLYPILNAYEKANVPKLGADELSKLSKSSADVIFTKKANKLISTLDKELIKAANQGLSIISINTDIKSYQDEKFALGIKNKIEEYLKDRGKFSCKLHSGYECYYITITW